MQGLNSAISQLDAYLEISKWLVLIRDFAIIVGAGFIGFMYRRLLQVKKAELEALQRAHDAEVRAIKERTSEKAWESFQALKKTIEAHNEQLKRELRHVKEQLAASEEKSESMERRAKSLEKQIESANRLIKSLSDAYQVIQPSYHYKRAEITYIVDDEQRDEAIRHFVIPWDQEAIFSEDFEFGVIGRREEIKSFDDIDLRCEVNGEIVDPIKTGEGPGVIKARLLFPDVELGSTVDLKLQTVIAGTWDKLRQEGKDQGEYNLKRPADVFEIRIILPKVFKEARFLNRHPVLGGMKMEADESGRVNLVWQIANAQPTIYEYEIEARK